MPQLALAVSSRAPGREHDFEICSFVLVRLGNMLQAMKGGVVPPWGAMLVGEA